MGAGNFILDLFAIHFSVGKVAEDASEILAIDVSSVGGVVESEGIFDLVLLNREQNTISSVSLLLRLAFLPPLLCDTFFLRPFMISYKIIYTTHSKENY